MPKWYHSQSERKKQNYFKKIQKRQAIYRTDNIEVIPIQDFLPTLTTYFSVFPRNKIILDFSELNHNNNQAVFSPKGRSSLPNSLISSLTTSLPAVDDSLTKEIEETEDFSLVIKSYLNPVVTNIIKNLIAFEEQTEGVKTIKLSDLSIYTGQIRNKKPCGNGIVYYSNGDVYQGSFENGERKGKGRIIYSEGDWFEGSWKEDIPAGSGIYHFANGRVIQGNFLQNDVIGIGVELLQNGDRYEGSFLGKKRHGKGILKTQNWKYEGKFRLGEISGSGVVKFNDGREFVGEFQNNIGTGILKYTDLTYYEGKIVDFKEEGEAELVTIDGIRKKGIWEQGNLKFFYEDAEGSPRNSEIKESSEESYSGVAVELVNTDDLISVMVIK